jgi:mono/diheme cytochrome c family protein
MGHAQDAPKKTIERVRARPTRTIDAKEMFHEYCAVCHGDQAKGNGPAAEALVKPPADLTQISRRNGGKFPKVQVMRVIDGADTMAAHGSRAMPVWGNVFRTLENPQTELLRVNALMEYLEKMQAN